MMMMVIIMLIPRHFPVPRQAPLILSVRLSTGAETFATKQQISTGAETFEGFCAEQINLTG